MNNIKLIIKIISLACIASTIFLTRVMAQDTSGGDTVEHFTGIIEIDRTGVLDQPLFIRIKGPTAYLLFASLVQSQPVVEARYCNGAPGETTHWRTVKGQSYGCQEISSISNAYRSDESITKTTVTCYLMTDAPIGNVIPWTPPLGCRGGTGIAGVINSTL